MAAWQIILTVVGTLFIAGFAFWLFSRYRETHSCSTCRKLHHSNAWFQTCADCGKRFCSEKIARHEDMIETVQGVLGETVRLIDRIDRTGARHRLRRNDDRRANRSPCGYEHIITLHRGSSVSSYYCPACMRWYLAPGALLDRYRTRRRASHVRQGTAVWR